MVNQSGKDDSLDGEFKCSRFIVSLSIITVIAIQLILLGHTEEEEFLSPHLRVIVSSPDTDCRYYEISYLPYSILNDCEVSRNGRVFSQGDIIICVDTQRMFTDYPVDCSVTDLMMPCSTFPEHEEMLNICVNTTDWSSPYPLTPGFCMPPSDFLRYALVSLTSTISLLILIPHVTIRTMSVTAVTIIVFGLAVGSTDNVLMTYAITTLTCDLVKLSMPKYLNRSYKWALKFIRVLVGLWMTLVKSLIGYLFTLGTSHAIKVVHPASTSCFSGLVSSSISFMLIPVLLAHAFWITVPVPMFNTIFLCLCVLSSLFLLIIVPILVTQYGSAGSSMLLIMQIAFVVVTEQLFAY
jgi:hypothetical protein